MNIHACFNQANGAGHAADATADDGYAERTRRTRRHYGVEKIDVEKREEVAGEALWTCVLLLDFVAASNSYIVRSPQYA